MSETDDINELFGKLRKDAEPNETMSDIEYFRKKMMANLFSKRETKKLREIYAQQGEASAAEYLRKKAERL